MKELVIATNNLHKVNEIKALISEDFRLLSLADIGCNDSIEETENTLEGNAFLKANFIYTKYGIDCFADDTGLEVIALNGLPGVHSARFAGEDCDSKANITKLLSMMTGIKNRKARFRTVISLIMKGSVHTFEGTVPGTITHETNGSGGFGYDPVFVPDGYIKTFAEMSLQEKNLISHRSMAVNKLVLFLNKLKD